MTKPNIVIGLSTRGKDIHHKLLNFLITQYVRTDIDVVLAVSECNVSAMVTVEKLWKTVKDVKFDYLLFVDSDTVPASNTIDVLIATGKDVVVAPIWYYDVYMKELHLNVHYVDDTQRLYMPKSHGVERIGASSLGTTLITRKVYDTFVEAGEHPVMWSKLIDKDYEFRHNDNIFFAKLRALGIEAYVNWDAIGVEHYTAVGLSTESLTNFLKNAGFIND